MLQKYYKKNQKGQKRDMKLTYKKNQEETTLSNIVKNKEQMMEALRETEDKKNNMIGLNESNRMESNRMESNRMESNR